MMNTVRMVSKQNSELFLQFNPFASIVVLENNLVLHTGFNFEVFTSILRFYWLLVSANIYHWLWDVIEIVHGGLCPRNPPDPKRKITAMASASPEYTHVSHLGLS